MTCTTHHHACECRERQFQELREYALRLETALRLLVLTCEDARWPIYSEHMMPLANARAVLASKPELTL